MWRRVGYVKMAAHYFESQSITMIQGGYDECFVHESIVSDYYCVICKLVARDVHQVNCCGQLMCHQCLETAKKACPQTCPHCRGNISGHIFHDKKTQQKILSLSVYCSNKSYGCKWTGELRYHREHSEEHCMYKLTTCPDCHKQIPIEKIKQHHLNECLRRDYRCPYCNKPGKYDEICHTHVPNCPECPVPCPNGCRDAARIKRRDIDEHRKHCSKQLVRCRFHSVGCQIVMPRDQQQHHERQCAQQHCKVMKTQTGVPERQLAATQYVMPITFCIDGYQTRKEKGDIWQSHPFFTHSNGYCVCFRVYLNGCKPGGGCLSCYIHVTTGPFDDNLSWPLQCVFEVELINRVEDYNHHKKDVPFITHTTQNYNNRVHDGIAAIGLGEPKYISHNDLESNLEKGCQYLQEDCLVFRITYKRTTSCFAKWCNHIY